MRYSWFLSSIAKNEPLQKLNVKFLLEFQNTVCAITCIAVVSTVDYMIAVGTSIGVVTVFLIPKVSPCNVPDVFKTNTKKQVKCQNNINFLTIEQQIFISSFVVFR